jgi:hypothetical protein
LQDTPESWRSSAGSRKTIGRPNDNGTATEAGENDFSPGNREPQGEDRNPAQDRKAHRFAETLRRQFREVVNALTRRNPEPHPTQRRRRTEETTGGFILAAQQIMRRSVSLPQAAFAAVVFLTETLDWLNPWHHESINAGALDEELSATEQHHIYPHL